MESTFRRPLIQIARSRCVLQRANIEAFFGVTFPAHENSQMLSSFFDHMLLHESDSQFSTLRRTCIQLPISVPKKNYPLVNSNEVQDKCSIKFLTLYFRIYF